MDAAIHLYQAGENILDQGNYRSDENQLGDDPEDRFITGSSPSKYKQPVSLAIKLPLQREGYIIPIHDNTTDSNDSDFKS